MVYVEYKKITKLAPYISSENLGDRIINDYCSQQIDEIFQHPFCVDIPTRDVLGEFAKKHIVTSDFVLVCGTNLLSSNMRKYHQWNIGFSEILSMQAYGLSRRRLLEHDYLKNYLRGNRMILMGVGWWQYQEDPDEYTKKLYRLALSEDCLHSVRDSYTETMLKKCGIENVVNTACPTMWKLTREHCKEIPEKKASDVVTTLTNYNVDRERNERLLEILLRQYRKVYVWLQAIEDFDEIQKSRYFQQIEIVPPSLQMYDNLLWEKNVDYVGTRLHGGIRALNAKRRSIIIAVDNRALEIAKDTGLQVIKREQINEKLERLISSTFETVIELPEENIRRWKGQFGKHL